MRRNRLEIKIDILKKIAEHPEWSASRQVYASNYNNEVGQKILDDLKKKGLIIIRYKGRRRYTRITAKGVLLTKAWDDVIRRLGGK